MSRAEGRSNELHDRPRPLTGGVLYATRTPARPLRQGDRVKDTAVVYCDEGPERNYPGCASYATVIAVHLTSATLRYDDGFEGRVSLRDLERL